MGSLSWAKAKYIFPFTTVACFCVFAAGIVLVSVFGPPYDCPNLSVLPPGCQASCKRTASDMFYSAEATTDSHNTSLVTYVFNKQPERSFFEQNYTWNLKKQTSGKFHMGLMHGFEYKWRIDVDVKMDLFIRTRKTGKVVGYIYYQKRGISKAEGSYTAGESNPRTYFLLTSSKPATGTFYLTVRVPQWNLTSVDPVDRCDEYPCKWIFSNYSWAEDSNVWIVTLNNGTQKCDVSMTLTNNQAIWITVPVIMIVLSIVCFFVVVVAIDHGLCS